jgi:hypothetical protein
MTIKEKWKEFRKKVISESAPPLQVLEMRRAFYAGVTAMMHVNASIWLEDEEEAIGMLESIDRELKEFTKDILKGVA